MAIGMDFKTRSGVVVVGGYAVVSRVVFVKTGLGDRICFVVKLYASKVLRDAGMPAVDNCVYAGEFLTVDNVTAVNKQCYEFLRGRCVDVDSYEYGVFKTCEEV